MFSSDEHCEHFFPIFSRFMPEYLFYLYGLGNSLNNPLQRCYLFSLIRTVLAEILFSSIDVRVPSECVFFFLRLTGLPFVE